MANMKNIEPYSRFAHKASLYGGPEKYVEKTFEAGVNCGIKIGKEMGNKKGIVKEAEILTGRIATVALAIYGTKKLGNRIMDPKSEKWKIKARAKCLKAENVDKIKEVMSEPQEVGNIDQEERSDG